MYVYCNDRVRSQGSGPREESLNITVLLPTAMSWFFFFCVKHRMRVREQGNEKKRVTWVCGKWTNRRLVTTA
jgi:hypothetical protein